MSSQKIIFKKLQRSFSFFILMLYEDPSNEMQSFYDGLVPSKLCKVQNPSISKIHKT